MDAKAVVKGLEVEVGALPAVAGGRRRLAAGGGVGRRHALGGRQHQGKLCDRLSCTVLIPSYRYRVRRFGAVDLDGFAL